MRQVPIFLLLTVLLWSPMVLAAQQVKPFSIGDQAPEFTLTSTQGLFDYVNQIYGSHHLILTFFPAAFTPV